MRYPTARLTFALGLALAGAAAHCAGSPSPDVRPAVSDAVRDGSSSALAARPPTLDAPARAADAIDVRLSPLDDRCSTVDDCGIADWRDPAATDPCCAFCARTAASRAWVSHVEATCSARPACRGKAKCAVDARVLACAGGHCALVAP